MSDVRLGYLIDLASVWCFATTVHERNHEVVPRDGPAGKRCFAEQALVRDHRGPCEVPRAVARQPGEAAMRNERSAASEPRLALLDAAPESLKRFGRRSRSARTVAPLLLRLCRPCTRQRNGPHLGHVHRSEQPSRAAEEVGQAAVPLLEEVPRALDFADRSNIAEEALRPWPHRCYEPPCLVERGVALELRDVLVPP